MFPHSTVDSIVVVISMAQSAIILGLMVESIFKRKINQIHAIANRNNAVSAYRSALFSMLSAKIFFLIIHEKGAKDKNIEAIAMLDELEEKLPSYDEMMESDKPLTDHYFLTDELREIVYMPKTK